MLCPWYTPPGSTSPSSRVSLFSQCNEPGEPHTMKISNSLEQAKGRVLFPVLDLVHVTWVAAYLRRHILA